MTEYLGLEDLLALVDDLQVGPLRDLGLVDWNNRLGWLATVVFLDINGAWVEASDDDAYDVVIAVARGRTARVGTAETLARWH